MKYFDWRYDYKEFSQSENWDLDDSSRGFNSNLHQMLLYYGFDHTVIMEDVTTDMYYDGFLNWFETALEDQYTNVLYGTQDIYYFKNEEDAILFRLTWSGYNSHDPYIDPNEINT